jgi:hypothetical protein
MMFCRQHNHVLITIFLLISILNYLDLYLHEVLLSSILYCPSGLASVYVEYFVNCVFFPARYRCYSLLFI